MGHNPRNLTQHGTEPTDLNPQVIQHTEFNPKLLNACYNCPIDFKLLGIIPLTVRNLQKAKLLYNHYQKDSMLI